jgi:hypothetical protein
VSSHDASIRLDTGAFGAARRRRAGRTAAYWLLLILGAAAIAAAIAVGTALLDTGTTTARLAPQGAKAAPPDASPATPAPAKGAGRGGRAAAEQVPPPSETPLAVWNGYGGQGAATVVADRAKAAGYTVVGVRDAPRRTYRTTYVLYVPGREAAAKALAQKVGLSEAAVRPLDGIRPAAIRPAQLLVILAG